MIECDNCKDVFEDGNGFSIFPDALHTDISDSGWIEQDGKDYCSKCHNIDDNDEIIIDKNRFKQD